MTVITHAQNNNVELECRCFKFIAEQRHEFGRCRLALQQVLTHLPRVGARAVFVNLPFVDDCDCHLVPGDGFAAEVFKEQCGCSPAGYREGGFALPGYGAGEASCHTVSETRRQRFAVYEVVPRRDHRVDSCQVLPSRSISATDEAGPHVPDV